MKHERALRIERASEVSFTQIAEDEIVILNAEDESFHHLNASAVDLWLALETPKTVEELSHVLVNKYCESCDSYQDDVQAWVEDTAQKGLLTLHVDQVMPT